LSIVSTSVTTPFDDQVIPLPDTEKMFHGERVKRFVNIEPSP
jgi:hypothetical protein